MKLLAIGTNAKTTKSDQAEAGYLTAIMYLAPDDLAGKTVCPFAKVAGCSEACLNTAGRGGFTNVQRARIRKTQWFHEDREGFLAQLVRDIEAAVGKAARLGKRLAVRLNGTSDIQWERLPCWRDGHRHNNVMEAFPHVTFYDYTKIPTRRHLPANYRLVYSYSEATEKARRLGREKLAEGSQNVAIVFRHGLPEEFHGRPVIDGDKTDLRFLDPYGVVVGLKAKGQAKRDRSGFVVD